MLYLAQMTHSLRSFSVMRQAVGLSFKIFANHDLYGRGIKSGCTGFACSDQHAVRPCSLINRQYALRAIPLEFLLPTAAVVFPLKHAEMFPKYYSTGNLIIDGEIRVSGAAAERERFLVVKLDTPYMWKV